MLSKSYKGCRRYDKWYAAQKSCLNSGGSSPAMEKVGAETIFKQSVTKRILYYTSFCDDCYTPSSIGNSKTFTAVENAYGPEKLAKIYECIDHYQKRIGKRLQKKKRRIKAWWKRFSD